MSTIERNALRQLLEGVKSENITIDSAIERIIDSPLEELGFAVLDHHRALRKGFPEVVFCAGKTIEQVVRIFDRLVTVNRSVLATRATPETYAAVRHLYPDAIYNELAGTIVINRGENAPPTGKVLIVSAGTSDLPVAEEAAVTAAVMGNQVKKAYDVGVSGIHRLLAKLELIRWAHVVIVVAGMEGALPSVIGGLTDRPVIAVPASVGYGASFHGLAALLGMLNTCASGVCVVNIDNGFGAGAMASAITQLVERVAHEKNSLL